MDLAMNASSYSHQFNQVYWRSLHYYEGHPQTMTLARQHPTQRRKDLRTIGHSLNPIVTVAGNGLSEGVLTELERALEDHELIKVKLAIGDRETRKALADQLIKGTNAELIQAIGKVILIYRKAKESNKKSNLISR